MRVKTIIDKITRLEDEMEKTQKLRQQIITVLTDCDMEDSETAQISLSRKEAGELCHIILLNHLAYINDLIEKLHNIDIPDI